MSASFVLIIDDTIIGYTLEKCLGSFAHDKEDKNIVNIELLPKKGNDINLLEQINKIFFGIKDSPVLIFINLNFSSSIPGPSLNMSALEIAEEIRLSCRISNVVILLYSFDRNISTEQFLRFINLSGSVHFTLPVRLKELFASWITKAVDFNLSKEQGELIQKSMFAVRAQQVSKQYLRDFKHSIVDKILPQLITEYPSKIVNARYRAWLNERIQVLFSNQISELCGIDMQKEFRDEIRQIESSLKNIELANATKLRKEINKLEDLLRSVINKSVDFSGNWDNSIVYEVERQTLCKLIANLKDIFDNIWMETFYDLNDPKYVPLWQNIKSRTSEYFKLPLAIEITLWRLSIWVSGRGYKAQIEGVFDHFLDPLIEKIEYDDYRGASDIFNKIALANLKITPVTSLNTIFTLGVSI